MKKQEGYIIQLLPLVTSRCFCLGAIKSCIFTIFRQKALSGKTNAVDGGKRVRVRERSLAIPAPEANAEIQANLDVCKIRCFC